MSPNKFIVPIYAALAGLPAQSFAAPILDVDLASFAVLGASTVTNVPTSAIVGNVGVWSIDGANAITGFLSAPGVATPDPQVTGGLVHAGTAEAGSAQGQLTTAINHLSSLGVGTVLPAADLSGLVLPPGVYTVPAGTTNLSGTLTLDGLGNANAAWLFQMPSTLITSPNAVVSIMNTGAGAGVYWNVGSSATIDVNTTFLGNILAAASITMNTGATDMCGRALADSGAVTLDGNSVSGGGCSGELEGSDGLNGGFDVTTADDGTTTVTALPFEPVTPVPLPASALLLGFAVTSLVGMRKRVFRHA